MNFSEQLEKIFITEEEIPAEFKLPSYINQKIFLLNGEMVQWMKLYCEEQFEPVIPVVPYKSMKEPIKYLTKSAQGQQVNIFGNDSHEITSLIDILVNQASRVNINEQCRRGSGVFPLAGRKDSAEEKLSVAGTLRSFSIRSLAAAKMNDNNKHLLNEIISGKDSNFLSIKFIF